MKKIKKSCWFSHKFTKIKFFKIKRFNNSILLNTTPYNNPYIRKIFLVFNCKDCSKTIEKYHSTVNCHIAENVVKSLNFEFNLKPPY